MKAIRSWVVLGGLTLLAPNLMGGCAEELEDAFRDVSQGFDNLADDIDGDDDNDLDNDVEDFFDDLFDDDDD